MSRPLVSVRVATYNQERYIAQCLEGVLMQRTDFPFEIVVGEDCSTDQTRRVVEEYRAGHPDLVRVVTAPANVGAARNSMRIQQACAGKYHALCEGDDYWIDPLKLQKQVDLMERDPGVSLCFHNAFIVDVPASVARLVYAAPPPLRSFEDACRLNTPTASVVFRADVAASLPEWRLQIWCGDQLLRLWCAHHGKLAYIDEVMSVYRRHDGGMTRSLRRSPEEYLEQELCLLRRFDEETGHAHADVIQTRVRLTRRLYQRAGSRWRFFLLHPLEFAGRLRASYASLVRLRRLFG